MRYLFIYQDICPFLYFLLHLYFFYVLLIVRFLRLSRLLRFFFTRRHGARDVGHVRLSPGQERQSLFAIPRQLISQHAMEASDRRVICHSPGQERQSLFAIPRQFISQHAMEASDRRVICHSPGQERQSLFAIPRQFISQHAMEASDRRVICHFAWQEGRSSDRFRSCRVFARRKASVAWWTPLRLATSTRQQPVVWTHLNAMPGAFRCRHAVESPMSGRFPNDRDKSSALACVCFWFFILACRGNGLGSDILGQSQRPCVRV